MLILFIVVVGVALGSFINALVWRIREQELEEAKKKPSQSYLAKLSIVKGRSICPNCKHELAAIDLIPVVSWVYLRGRCRYCHKKISAQYPIVELATCSLFLVSYIFWPINLHGTQVAIFILWLGLLTGLIALFIYDLKWFLLPNRIVYPLGFIAIAIGVLNILVAQHPLKTLLDIILAILVGGGIFYLLFQFSGGKWIGGGDVKLGFVLGLIAGTPARSLLFIFIASLTGTIISLPLMLTNKLRRGTLIPFGPLLIIGLIVVQLFGAHLLHWYRYTLIGG